MLTCKDKLILNMLEIIRFKFMRKIQGRMDKIKKWTKTICPRIFKKPKINKAKARGCVTIWLSRRNIQVGIGGIS